MSTTNSKKKIFEIHRELLTRMSLFGDSHVVEESARLKPRPLILKTNNQNLINSFGEIEVFGQQAIFRYRDKEHVEKWFGLIQELRALASEDPGQNRILLKQIDLYLQTVKIVGEIIVRENEIKAEEA